MNRFSRAFSSAAIALAAVSTAAAVAGCGTGQLSQTADQASAVNGASANVGDLALRDVRIQAVQSGDALEPGNTVDLVFVATNQSQRDGDELTAISSDVGKVSVTGTKTLPAGGALIVTAPVAPDLASATSTPKVEHGTAHGTESTAPTAATVTLDKSITNGVTYNFTFDFKRAGQVKLAVPISAQGAAHL